VEEVLAVVAGKAVVDIGLVAVGKVAVDMHLVVRMAHLDIGLAVHIPSAGSAYRYLAGLTGSRRLPLRRVEVDCMP